MSVYVLTRSINDYNQDGEYFVAVFNAEPTEKQLVDCGVDPGRREFMLKGGGRIDYEHEWYMLTKTEFGKRYGDD